MHLLFRRIQQVTGGLSAFGIWLSTCGNPLAKATKADTNLLLQYLSEVREYADGRLNKIKNRPKVLKEEFQTLRRPCSILLIELFMNCLSGSCIWRPKPA